MILRYFDKDHLAIGPNSYDGLSCPIKRRFRSSS